MRLPRPTLLVAIVAALAASPSIGEETQKRFIVYDQQQYSPYQLELAARSPVVRQVAVLKNGAYWVPRSPDGHFYVQGAVNGFPVVFMIDTGASQSTIPERYARNSGIRTGLEVVMNTAGGRVSAGETRGNRVQVGPFNLSNATVIAAPNLDQPLLGMSVLDRFTMTTDGVAMTLAPRSR